MPKGASGRVVIELEPLLKRRLYSALAIENLTLKEWFVGAASHYLAERDQPALPNLSIKSKTRAKPQ